MLGSPRVLRVALAGLFAAAASVAAADARTATYVEFAPLSLDAAALTALSTSGDSAGPTVSLGQMIGILFSEPIGAVAGDSVSIFTLPSAGTARATISFGSWNAGAPTLVWSRQVNAGSAIRINNLLQRGCAALGGCDFIRIVTDRQSSSSPGVTFDYVDVNGEVVTVVEAAPEPDAWALFVVGFAVVALRLKVARRRIKARVAAA